MLGLRAASFGWAGHRLCHSMARTRYRRAWPFLNFTLRLALAHRCHRAGVLFLHLLPDPAPVGGHPCPALSAGSCDCVALWSKKPRCGRPRNHRIARCWCQPSEVRSRCALLADSEQKPKLGHGSWHVQRISGRLMQACPVHPCPIMVQLGIRSPSQLDKAFPFSQS